MNADIRSARVADTLARMQNGLADGLIPIEVFNNRDIYEEELRRIFARSWVFIGHESELPNKGDYALRYIGEDPFIFVRGADGELRVLFNACRHRGVQVCRAEMGNTQRFTCPYHGWVYENTGALVSVPARQHGYRELDMAAWGLVAAPNVVNHHGLVFANLDPNAVSFAEYIGRFAWYLDIQLLLSEGGMEVIGEPQRWEVDANWKQGAENFCGDSSHTASTHASTLEVGIVRREAAGAANRIYGMHVHDCDGFAVSIRQLPEESPFFGYPEEVTRHFRPGRLTEAQFNLARRGLVHNGTIFPNFSFLHIAITDTPERPEGGFLTVRVWQPKGPGRMEIWNWMLAPREAPEAYKRRAYQLGMSSFGASGSFEQDDVAVWPGIARSARTVFAETSRFRLNYQMGLGAMGDVEPVPDWPGPGRAMPSNAGEGGLRTFHANWLRRMTAGG